MESSARSSKTIRFGPFEADLTAERLIRNGLPVRLQDLPLRLLLLLLERPGEIVSREDLRSCLWPTDSYGDFDNGLNVAVRKARTALGDDTDRPKYIETVPRRGYRFIAEIQQLRVPIPATAIQAPESEPAALSQSHSATALAPGTVPEPAIPSPDASIPPGHSGPRRQNLRTAVAILSLGILIAVIVFAPGLRRKSKAPASMVPAKTVNSRRSVAVLGFRNSSRKSEDAWLSTALAEMFSTELAAGDHLRLISGEDVAHMHLTQAQLDVDSISSSTARQIHQALGPDLILCGSYVSVDSSDSHLIRLDVRLQDAASGEILTEFSDNGNEKAIFQLVSNVGEQLRQKLGVSAVSATEHSQVMASMPASREAGELYSNGLARLRAYDAAAARGFLEQSIAADPAFPLAHAALSEAWERLGYDHNAVEEAQKASDLAVSLLPTERLQVQARSAEVKGEWEKAAEAYRSLHASFPDDPQFTVLLASALTRGGKGKDALALLESVLTSPASTTTGEENAQIQLAIADAAEAIGNMDRASQASEAAASMARAKGQTLLVAQALRTLGLVLEFQKQFAKALQVTEEARHIYESAGDSFGVASILEVQANVLTDQGSLPGALDTYRQELAIARAVGNRRGQASALNNIALVLNQQGYLESSRSMWEESELAFRDLGDKSNTAVVLVNIGGVFKDQGQIAAAKSRYQEAWTLAKSIHDASDTTLAMNAVATALDSMGDFAGARKLLLESSAINQANGQSNAASENLIDLGDVLRHQGDLVAAEHAYRNALGVSQASGEKTMTAYSLSGLAQIAFLHGDFAAARRYDEQALQIRKSLGELFSVAETETAMAEVALAEHHASDAEPILRRSRDVYRKARRQDDSARLTALLVQALLAQNKTAEAANEASSLPSSGQIQQIETRLAVRLAQASIAQKLGRLSEAQEAIRAVSKEANSSGYQLFVLESRLAQLQIQPDSSLKSAGLRQFSKAAQDAGFGFLSQR